MNALVKHNGNDALSPAESAELNKYLSITMRDEAYGIEVLRIKEIIEYGGMTAVPMMPDFVRGAFNLRGRGVPIIDLAVRFGKGETAIGKRTCVVIVEALPEGAEAFDVGMLVDAVNEVVDIEPTEIEAAPSLGGKVRTDFLKGMGKVKGDFLLLLNIDRILSLEDLEVAAKAAEQV